jgi:hypothetical protein
MNNKYESMIDSCEETITISREEYRELVKDSDELNRLIINGVHNWEGYSIGIEDEEDE